MKRLALLIALAALPIPAWGQTRVIIMDGTTVVGTSHPLPITGTITATLGGFTPSASGARGTPLSVTTSDSSGNLPTGAVVIVSNVGTTNPMYCNVNAIAATTSDQLISANGGWFAFTIPAAVTTLRCIATGGSTTANTLGGAGLATGTGGGSGGSGGGGAVTLASGAVSSGAYSSGSVASGAFASGAVSSGAFASGALASGSVASGAVVDLGAQADTACATDNGTCSEIALTKRGNQRLTTLNTTLGSPFQAGGSIGNTTFAATQATAASLNATVVGTGTFAVQATLAAETTKVIGTVNVAAAQTIAVTQATAASLNATVVGTGTFVTQSTLAAETTKVIGTVRTVGNVGGVLDAIGQNVTAPANWLQMGCQFNTSPTTISSGSGSPCQLDNAGNLKVNVAVATGLAQGSTTSGQTGSLIMGAVTTASPSYTTAQTSPLSLDTAGSLRVAIISGAGSGGTAIADGATFTEATTSFTPVGGEYVSGGGANCTTGKGCTLQMTIDRMAYMNLGKVNAVTVLTGTGAVGTGAQRIAVGTDTATIAGSAPGTAGSASANVLSVQGVASMTPVFVASSTAPVVTMNSASANAGINAAMAGVFDDTSPTSITENSFGFLRMSANRNLYGTLRDAAGNERGVNVTAGNSLQTDITSVAGTAVVNGGVAGSQSVGGTVATNVAITANPLNLGVQAVSSENTAVTTARQVQLVADLVGKLIVLPYSNPENFVSGVITTAMTGTTTTSLVAAPASGLRNYLTACTFSNAHATVGTDIIIQDGSGGTTIWNVPAAAVYGGAHITFPTPLRQPTTATAIFVANVTTGASTKAACSGYKGA